MAKDTKHQDFRFEIKEVTDEGTFEGFASVYGVLDNGGDIVEKGAFARTLNAHPDVPILWRHEHPIGKGHIEDSDRGLIVKGRLTMAVAQAKEALALMKDGVVSGLSIGFRAMKDEVVNSVRHLKEVRLYEVSIVPFPMNEAATITKVKEMPKTEQKDFVSDLDRIQTDAGHYMMMSALDSALYDCKWMEGDAETKTAEAGKCIDQFKAAYMEWFPRYMAMRAMKSDAEREVKEGRKLSTETRAKLEAAMADHRAAMEKLQALLDAGTEKAAPAPAEKSADPVVDHSKLSSLIDNAKEAFTWTPSSRS